MTTTVNRGWLKRQIQAGKVEAKCNYVYTDDYAFDNSVKFQKTDWIPARIRISYDDRKENYMNFWEDDFRGYGRAWKRDNADTIVLYFGYKSYELRIV